MNAVVQKALDEIQNNVNLFQSIIRVTLIYSQDIDGQKVGFLPYTHYLSTFLPVCADSDEVENFDALDTENAFHILTAPFIEVINICKTPIEVSRAVTESGDQVLKLLFNE